MAGKAAIIKDEVGIALEEDPEYRKGLGRQFSTFKDNLLPNLTPGEFADIYAETITYGMFAARLHDDTLETFSRQEALDKLPKSNPFLRGLFQFIAGYDIPDRLRYVVDDLAEVLRASDPHSLFEDFGKFTARNDPFIHFYETFLAAYNPKKRKSRGVWYTPEPVVDFIVRAVDDVLKTEFDIADGLADTGKVTVDWDTGQTDRKGKPVTIRKDVHRVQILDPATGTGTFLAKTVQTIADRVKARAPGKWSSYVEEELLPRLHGFELLMASYAMCHMKLDMQLTESGYVPSKNPPRLSVWLTNALEPAEREVKDLFFQQLADEARGASEVKRQTPIMCVIGNPPYAISGLNNNSRTERLVKDFKANLSERNLQPLSDDYLKFIGLAIELIEKRGSGVLAFVCNNSFLDGVIHRSARKRIVLAFHDIRIFNLHGDSNKFETAPDGSRDDNVFDIRQGVCIIIASKVKAGEKTTLRHIDIFGTRLGKEEILRSANVCQQMKLLELDDRYCFFVPKNFSNSESYTTGFSIEDLFGDFVNGIATHRDHFLIENHSGVLADRFSKFLSGNLTEFEAQSQFGVKKTSTWNLTKILNNCKFKEDKIRPITYRPLDNRFIYFDVEIVERHREPVMRNMFRQNMAILSGKQNKSQRNDDFFVTQHVSEKKTAESTSQSFIFPLYLYPDDKAEQADALASTERTLNLDPKLFAKICKAAGINPTDQAGPEDDFRAPTGDARPSEIKVFDYIYGVLHSPDYRKTFAEFLKIDFPRIPYPASPELFQHVSEKGEALRRLHLMEAPAIGDTPYVFHGEGDDMVASGYPKFEQSSPVRGGGGREAADGGGSALDAASEASPLHHPADGPPPRAGEDLGRVQINPDQYFDGVPKLAWDFYIGGYQPAQKWLKDRRGRVLSYEDLGHYQKIIKILSETDRIMKEIKLPLD
ncbi:type ISP restriction/modification enzyme [Parasphingorhabdus sp.]|uniref:type ISP restriction/modification enzyme n=1 Tax=Parasphingorhabdus sp. TaxID=2709688 RepID=UPI003A956D27